MEQIYSLQKRLAIFFLSLILGGIAIGQQPICGPVVETFNNTGGSMAGFTSSTENSTAPGFVYGQTGQNGYLQRCAVSSAGTVYEIVSPTYQPFGSPTFVGYGFELSGAVLVTRVDVYFQYVDNMGQVNSVIDTTFNNPVYTGSGSNTTLTICDSFLLSRAAGFTPGERYRIIIEVTAASASNNNQCIVFDNFRASGTVAAAPLPVAFTGFGAKKVTSGVELIWSVAGEFNVQSYTVERSTTGSAFSKVGDVAATGSSTYSFVDDQPVNGVTFYRIKEVDIDGKFKYSTIVRLNLNRNASLRVYPSPAKSEVTIEHGISAKGKLSISTADGRVIRHLDIKPEISQTVLNISNLKAGLYVIRFVNADGQSETVKLIKE